MQVVLTRRKTACLVALTITLLGAIGMLGLHPFGVWEVAEPEDGFDSPRLTALAIDLMAGKHSVLDRFWEEMAGRSPLIEPIADDPGHSWVTFIWRGDSKTRRVGLAGGPPTGVGAPLARLGNTDVWYRTERIPNDSRFMYSFQVNRARKMPEDLAGLIAWFEGVPLRPDPLNSRNASGSPITSPVELPGAIPQPWLQRIDEVPRGETVNHTIQSVLLKGSRTFTIYLPPDYGSSKRANRLVVLFDGASFLLDEWIPAPVILDNLIAEKSIQPLVVVFVDQSAERNKELACSEPFANFVSEELVPWVREHYRVYSEPSRTIIGGSSLGGLMASYCSLHHSDVFGNVLSLSGSYLWFPGLFEGAVPPDRNAEPGWLTRQFVTSPSLPIRFYLAAGRFENGYPISLLTETRRFRDVLEAKGCTAQYREYNGGHDVLGWRGPFVEGLTALIMEK
jgi:enterochelin esterase-like enzyme